MLKKIPLEKIGHLSYAEARSLVLGRPEQLDYGLPGPLSSKIILDPERANFAVPANRERFDSALRKWLGNVEEIAERSGRPVEEVERAEQRSFQNALFHSNLRKPTALELAAIFAWQHGLDKQKMTDELGSLRHIERTVEGGKEWEGDLSGILGAIYKDWPLEIEHLLLRRRRILSTEQIAREVGVNLKNAGERSRLSVALQLLEHAGLARREIPNSTEKGRIDTWAHNAHADLKIEHNNLPLAILKALHHSQKHGLPVRELSGPEAAEKHGINFSRRSVLTALKELASRGLVATAKKTTPRPVRGAIPQSWHILTPRSEELMQDLEANGGKSFQGLRLWLVAESPHFKEFAARPEGK